MGREGHFLVVCVLELAVPLVYIFCIIIRSIRNELWHQSMYSRLPYRRKFIKKIFSTKNDRYLVKYAPLIVVPLAKRKHYFCIYTYRPKLYFMRFDEIIFELVVCVCLVRVSGCMPLWQVYTTCDDFWRTLSLTSIQIFSQVITQRIDFWLLITAYHGSDSNFMRWYRQWLTAEELEPLSESVMTQSIEWYKFRSASAFWCWQGKLVELGMVFIILRLQK